MTHGRGVFDEIAPTMTRSRLARRPFGTQGTFARYEAGNLTPAAKRPVTVRRRSEARKYWLSIFIGLFVLIGIQLPATHRANHSLYCGVDGRLFIALMKNAGTHPSAWLNSEISHLQGMGTHHWPMGAWLHPCWYILRGETTFAAILASYTFSAALFYLSICILARSLKVRAGPAIFAAQFSCFALFPPLGNFSKLHMLFGLSPNIANIVALELIAVALLINSGCRRASVRVTATVLLPLTVLYSVICEPLWTTVFGIGLVVFGAAPSAIGPLRHTLKRRGLAMAALVALLLLVRLPQYLRGLMSFTARTTFRTEIIGEVQHYHFAYMPFQNATVAGLFAILLVGITLALRDRRRAVRVFAAACLLHMAVLTVVGILFLYSDINWTHPLPVYLEIPAIPIYVVVAAVGWCDSARRLRRALAAVGIEAITEFRLRALGHAALIALPLVAVIGVTTFPQTQRALGGPWIPPTAESPAVTAAAEKVRWRPDASFQGSVATIFPKERASEAHELHAQLWLAGAPTMEEYSVLVSPQYFYFVSRALGKSEDGVSGRNSVHAFEPRFGVLEAMGVRYVITPNDYSSAPFPLRLQNEFPDGSDKILRLYELPNPNLGTYSPTEVSTVDSAPEAMRRLLSSTMKFDRDVVLFETLNEQLVAASESTIRFIDGAVRIHARSAGRSLVLLPLQYSNGLKVASNIGGPRLLRANIAQTAILFDREVDAEIRLEHSLFRTEGRSEDIADMQRFHIGEDGSRKPSRDEEAALHPFQKFSLKLP